MSPLAITHVPLNHGGYDRRGKYWGVGPRLYEVDGPEGLHFYLRAVGILDAKRRLRDPDMLYREGYIRAHQRDQLRLLAANENPLGTGKMVALGALTIAAVGGLFYAVNASAKKSGAAAGGTGAKVTAPDGSSWKKLGPGDQATPGHTYLLSMSPIPGHSFVDLIGSVHSDTIDLVGSWDKGVPAGWPAGDVDATRWRVELTVKTGAHPLSYAGAQAEFPGLQMWELQGGSLPSSSGGSNGTLPAPPPAAGAITLEAIPGDNGYVNLALGHDIAAVSPGGIYVTPPPGATIVSVATHPDAIVAIEPQSNGSLLVRGIAVGTTILSLGWNSPGGKPTLASLELDVSVADGTT